MKNKVSENMANNPEEIENALNFLVDSKIIIISITIIFTFISLFYVLNTKPTYGIIQVKDIVIRIIFVTGLSYHF